MIRCLACKVGCHDALGNLWLRIGTRLDIHDHILGGNRYRHCISGQISREEIGLRSFA